MFLKNTGSLFVCFIITMVTGFLDFSVRADERGDLVILITSHSAIHMSRKNSSFNRLDIPNVGQPYGIDVDVELRMVFWTDTSNDQIKRFGIDDGDFAVVTSTGPGSSDPTGIALDPLEEEIYWTDTRTDNVRKVKYDGSGLTILAYYYRSDPVTIAVDSVNRMVYWIDNSYLRAMTCNGQNKRSLRTVGHNVYLPGIALNTDGSRVYWREDWNIRSRTTSSNSDERYVRASYYCAGLSWFEEQLYCADSSSNSLGIVNEHGGAYEATQYGSFSGTKDVFVGRLPSQETEDGKCDFEMFRCPWVWRNSEQNDLDWTKTTGGINSTGPILDHSRQDSSGKYMFIHTSVDDQAPGDVATLISPPINASLIAPKCFRFWYHMHAVTNGSLKVYFQAEPDSPTTKSTTETLLWTKYGSQSDEWVGAEMKVKASGRGRILIQAIVGDPAMNGVGIDDVGYGKCRQDSKLVCGSTSFEVYLDKARLGISTHDDVTLTSSSCRGYEHDPDTIAISSSYDSCGTAVRESDDVIVFSNQVSVSSQTGIRSSNIDIRINCTLSRNYRVDTSYFAHVWIKYIREEGYGNFSVRIVQYPGEKYEEPYPSSSYPLQVSEGDVIYMATEMSMVKDMVATENSRCWATQSPDPMDTVREELIRDGCPVGGGVKVYDLNVEGFQPFSFKAFSFAQDMVLIYVHCDIIVCRQSEATECSRQCGGSRHARESRSARVYGSGPHTVSQGPFISKRYAAENEGGMNVVLMTALTCMTVVILTATVVFGRRKLVK